MVVKMTREELVNHLVNEVKGSMTIGFTTRVPLEMRKGRGKANRNPYIDRVEVIRERSLFFGWKGYEESINGRLINKGCDGAFKTQPMNGRRWLHYGKIEESINNAERRYVRCYTKAHNKVNERYLVDGIPATEEQIKEFTPWIIPKTEDYSEKQAIVGLLKDEQVFPRCLGLDTILSLRINHKTIIIDR